ncbi:BamA/TamA family outer membrane protein [Chitinophaga rhizophila]|uniref:BamA/TamA family outer membrane protein n=1 Tax=Chitinophaga rhizophila TaxID=2866212 RepID=A0ABS7GHW7_9BACT|nr:BamA/TamA family outer membrane protein [Chitinophaga rhizophila]MBW8687294.1 BamA/TamA family outer membrane protein [Chitinophaga rhizophila]
MRLHILFAFLVLFAMSTVQAQTPAADSITIAIAPAYDSVGRFHRTLFGESYRKLWAAPVRMEVFYLDKEKGGLVIEQQGGGLQTKSLRLKDKAGKEWVLRTLQKYPERGLPPNLRATIARDILQDQVVTAHPYSSLTVPPLAAALGIPHANPRIVYVPDDPALGEYRKDFANAVFLFEEREPVEAVRTDNTEKTQHKLEEDNDAHVDQRIVLRARLLDMLLGDWDRHEDQWRWERVKQDKRIEYTPVPRDRDQVYYNTTGLFPWIISHQWLKSKFQGYHEHIRDIKGFNYNARFFDRYFLNSLSEADWREQIQYVQATLTDSLIRQSVSLMPDTIFRLSGEKIIRAFIARRNELEKEAISYYQFLSIYTDVPASDKHEYFDIRRLPDGHVTVTISKMKKEGTLDGVIYQRDFDPAVTKEVRLYGMDGRDVFAVSGAAASPIRIRMIGGDGVDSFIVGRDVPGKGRLYIYDRSDQDNRIPPRGSAKIRTDTDSLVNTYNRRAFMFDRFGPLPSIQYNPDQGFMLRVNTMLEKQGFRKTPYAQQHQLILSYVTGREAFLLQYLADYKQLIGKNDLRISILSRGPQNLSNFFGLGNESVFVNDDKEIAYYRNRYDLVNGDVRLYRSVGKGFTVSGGIAAQYYTSRAVNNKHRFLGEYDAAFPAARVFDDRLYAGLVAAFEADTRVGRMMPRKGIHWHTELTGMQQTNRDHKRYGRVTTDFSFFVPLIGDSTLVMANRFAAGTTIGDPAYFQMMAIGGTQILRGFHTNRFIGRTAVYHNFELRLKLFDFTSYLLPGTVGLIGFNDLGRVWMPGERSHRWHDGYGGGVYIVPVELFLIQAAIGFSEEGALPYITAGFRF